MCDKELLGALNLGTQTCQWTLFASSVFRFFFIRHGREQNAAMELEPLEFLESPWFLMAIGMLVAALHVCLTKSDVKLGLARLLEKCQQHKHVMTQR